MRPPVLALKSVRLADGECMLFDGVDLALEPRTRACLVGRNGAGKTTLLRMLAGLIDADGGERSVTPGAKVMLVAQEPLIEGDTLLAYATAGGAPSYQAEAALTDLGPDPKRGTQGLSGGETRRAALARAFDEEPDVLLLDEPTNHLDIFAIQTLEEMVAASKAAVLVVSHDRAFLERVTQRCFWLDNRRVWRLDKGFGEFDDWSERIEAAQAEEARKLDKMLERETHWLHRGVTARRARNEGRRRNLLALRAQKKEMMSLQRGELSMGLEGAGTSGKRVIEAKGLSKAYGDKVLLKDFSTRILRGDRVAIVGANGAGKTTLIKMLLGEVAPDTGSVKLGTNLDVVYLDQARAALKEGQTLWETLAPEGGDQIMVRGRPKHVAAYAKDFLFRENQLRQPVASLSGGERNRLLLSRALAQPANLLVLDEPTNDLDMDTLELLEDLLADYDGALLLVSHDRDFIDKLATSTIALDGRGRAVETPGGWKDFLDQNPGFFDFRHATPPAKAAPKPVEASKKAATKLSYKDQRRLEELEKLVADLPGVIAAHDAKLADADLYSRDPAGFDRIMKAADKARSDLAAAEEEWLELEEKRENLGATG
ncbi:MAG: ABC-F family ATP-binding cassette domain-containing protein [Caulobacterales bacterium]|nr:ABC-F family ATP-binding cassette domain-containing protein [Caulobacterales bacterium]